MNVQTVLRERRDEILRKVRDLYRGSAATNKRLWADAATEAEKAAYRRGWGDASAESRKLRHNETLVGLLNSDPLPWSTDCLREMAVTEDRLRYRVRKVQELLDRLRVGDASAERLANAESALRTAQHDLELVQEDS